ncbi:MAG: hypothetical protein M5U26_20365 [Planctomycetota bacterium]|nr:hypothetical protein [Planctomycetota bacterium]
MNPTAKEPARPDEVPPIGMPPAGQDFAHPWIVSAIVSALTFTIGFAVLKLTGLWTQFSEWADAPFMFYFAILMPVIVGFVMYGIYLAVQKLMGKAPARPAPHDEIV